jgi:hypothetical protein
MSHQVRASLFHCFCFSKWVIYRRSMTIMSGEQRNVCGLCITAPDSAQRFKSEAEVPSLFLHLSYLLISAFLPPPLQLDSCWVECSSKKCHAQYVVENVAALRVRPRISSATLHRIIDHSLTSHRFGPDVTTAAITLLAHCLNVPIAQIVS